MDDDAVLRLFKSMDSKIEELKNDNKSMRNEIKALKSNPAQYGESQTVGCTCDEQEKWRRITLMFIDDQEKALNDHKDSMKSDINQIQAHLNRLENNITELRKQVE